MRPQPLAARQAWRVVSSVMPTTSNCSKLGEGSRLQVAFHDTVYPVYPLPESVLSLVWDFGNPARNWWYGSSAQSGLEMAHVAVNFRTTFLEPVTDETIHIEALVHSIMVRGCTDNRGSQNFPALSCWKPLVEELNAIGADVHQKAIQSLITACVAKAQHFIREDVYRGDCSVASLRDIKRCVNLIPWILCLFDKRARAEKHLPAASTADTEIISVLPRSATSLRSLRCVISMVKGWLLCWRRGRSFLLLLHRTTQKSRTLPNSAKLRDALLISLIHCFAMRLNLRKEDLKSAIIEQWMQLRRRFSNLAKGFLEVPTDDEFWEPHRELTTFVCNQLNLEVGIARNDAMRENTFALFAGICTGTTTFLVGKPGTTKSLSMDLLAAM
eukprot:2804008-Amphidinium_carterae.1